MIRPEAHPPLKKVLAVVAGNGLEYYDFVTYAFFASQIGRAFFPYYLRQCEPGNAGENCVRCSGVIVGLIALIQLPETAPIEVHSRPSAPAYS